ncbi:MAG: hypothetical protein ACT4PJ_02210 [Gemmatimonadaceae bacterium]
MPVTTSRLPRLATLAGMIALHACGGERAPETDSPSTREAALPAPPPAASAAPQEEPNQWTRGEIARRLTDGGLVITDSGRTTVRHSFLAVDGHQMRVSGSDLQVFIYPNPAARRGDSERLDSVRVAPEDMTIDWVAPAHLIASGNLIAIHLTPNGRLAERVRLILEAWHAHS